MAKDHMKAEILKTLSNTSLSNAPRTEVGSSTTPDPSTSQHSTSRPQQTTVTESLIPQHNSAQANMDSASLVPTNSMTVANSDEDAPATTSLTSSSREPSQTVQNLLADRRRLEIDKTEKDAAEKAERLAKAEARRQAINAVPDSAKAKQAKYAQQQRKRQQEAKLERERIVRQIEHDKAERREKEERRRALARAEVEGKDGADGLVDQQLFDEVNAPQSMNSNACAVQVRLFDGSTIRNKFPSNQTLRTNVRGWLDEQRSDGDIPYTFKQILSPLPNRTLSISEEEESLQSLGLSPSATLVMVPVQGYIAAYGGNQGIVSRGASVGYSVVSAGAGLVTGALGTVLGLGRAAPQDVREANAAEGALEGSEPKANGSGSSFRTLQDQREDRQDHQLYNGNHVSFFTLRTTGISRLRLVAQFRTTPR